MGVRARAFALTAAAAALLLAAPLGAGGATKPAADVKAEGNPFMGGLGFDPPKVTVKVGQVVRWTNTDDTVPHTATEDHGLWRLTGTYGVGSSRGFGPGESRQRAFEASTAHYYCEVHPDTMRGVVRVPVRLSVKSLDGGKRRLVIRWASKTPATGRAFDVQVKRGTGDWKSFRKGTRETFGGKTTQGAKVTWSVRARLRKQSNASLATGWSPVAKAQA